MIKTVKKIAHYFNELPAPSGRTISDANEDATGLFGHLAHCWIMFSWPLTNTPRFISSTWSSSHTAPVLWCCLGLWQPKCNTWQLIKLDFIPLASVPLFRLSRFLWRAFLTICRLTLPPSLMSSANLLSVTSIPSTSHQNSPQYQPLGYTTHDQPDLILFTITLWA